MVTPILFKDFYKTDHRRQYPEGTEMVYSNLTARGSRLEGVDKTVVFGIQYFVKEYLIRRFNEDFFAKPKGEVIHAYKRRMDTSLGEGSIDVSHLEELHDLGYLPILIKALPEGTLCPLRVPMITIRNTNPKFFWLTNFLETLMSNVLWHPMTSATMAYQYRKILDGYAEKTSDMPEFVDFQGHDFSMRGHTSIESSMISGGAHLTSFKGTDTIPAIDWLEEYYCANADVELIGTSVPATEHSVMCLGGDKSEKETFLRLIKEVYPTGIVSIVSDTWDYWSVVNVMLRELKDDIMARDGKLVIRPDSGDPVKIVCGEPDALTEPERKGTIEVLWDIFGGTINSKGYKQLDPHIGCIYGDSITLERCEEICAILEVKGFASTNIVFGIGSFTYQYVTRDTFNFAVKGTYGEINGKGVEIFKDPITDNGMKKSARGLLKVDEDLALHERVTWEQEAEGLLETVFSNGMQIKSTSLSGIRSRIKNNNNGER